jgi:hypothetical protein
VTCDHDAIKADPVRWAALGDVHIQRIPADEYGPALVLEQRNCTCGSTLAVEIKETT